MLLTPLRRSFNQSSLKPSTYAGANRRILPSSLKIRSSSTSTFLLRASSDATCNLNHHKHQSFFPTYILLHDLLSPAYLLPEAKETDKKNTAMSTTTHPPQSTATPITKRKKSRQGAVGVKKVKTGCLTCK